MWYFGASSATKRIAATAGFSLTMSSICKSRASVLTLSGDGVMVGTEGSGDCTGRTPESTRWAGPALTLAIRKEKSIILEMCERRFIIRYERLRSLEWVGGRVVRRGCAARDGSSGSVQERA